MPVSPLTHRDKLEHHLDNFLQQAPLSNWLKTDPIQFPKRFEQRAQREIVAIFAALLAYGRVGLIARAMEEVLKRMGPDLERGIVQDSVHEARARFEGFVYRLTTGEDLARLWLGLGHVIRNYGSIRQALMYWDHDDSIDFRPLLCRLRTEVVSSTPDFKARKGFNHFLSNPIGGSAIKRYCMLMRWMVRGPDTVDLGDWSDLGTERLMLPIDTHVHRISRNLGLTKRASADWKTAVEITNKLKSLDPIDPTRFDFALAHLGISGSCPSKRVDKICTSCPINKICTLG